MNLIPINIKNKYEKKNFNASSNPQEIKEELFDLYSLNYEFPNLSIYNFICPQCKKLNNNMENIIPRITINLENNTIDSFCGGGHYGEYNLKDFYKKFIDQRFEGKEVTCS